MRRKTDRRVDPSTEEKILDAARRLFTQHGFDAVKTRDIAAAAGINIALVNYYFRSKEKLFEMIRLENLREFVQGINQMLREENKTLDEVIGALTGSYIDWLKTNPTPLLFLLNEWRKDPQSIDSQLNNLIPGRAELREKLFFMMKKEQMTYEDIFQQASNFIGLIMAPLITRNIMQGMQELSQDDYNRFMDERKRLIPLWLSAIKNIK